VASDDRLQLGKFLVAGEGKGPMTVSFWFAGDTLRTSPFAFGKPIFLDVLGKPTHGGIKN
jgi:hypothetical protein